jgi:hypothetical protein
VRGLLSPAGHTAWPGLTCAALWTLVEVPGTGTALAFVGTFLAVVALHAHGTASTRSSASDLRSELASYCDATGSWSCFRC